MRFSWPLFHGVHTFAKKSFEPRGRILELKAGERFMLNASPQFLLSFAVKILAIVNVRSSRYLKLVHQLALFLNPIAYSVQLHGAT